jgi:hypothetical protein
MSENDTDPTESEAAVAQEESREPDTDEALMSQEAKKYRLRLRDAEAQAAELFGQVAATAARAEAAERHVVEANLRGKFADTGDFWGKTELSELRGDNGTLDPAAVAARADELLDAHPHWRAPDPSRPLAASAGSVGSSGKIGFGPGSVLDGDNAALQEQSRSWGEFFTDAIKGKM